MRKTKIVLATLGLAFGSVPALALDPDSAQAKPSTCYISSRGDTLQANCVSEKGKASPLEAFSVIAESSAADAKQVGSVNLAYGGLTYTFDLDTSSRPEILDTEVSSQRRGGGFRGSGFYRGGGFRGGGFYRGAGVYRGGAVYRRGGIYRGARVAYRRGGIYYGGGSSYCGYAPYPPCYGGGYYGGGYYPGGAAIYRRGGAAIYRGGGYRGGFYRGGGYRGGFYRGGGYRGGFRGRR
jgi:hypothetical protein